MVDNDLAQMAFRNRALGLVVCTTGSTNLSATALGFARSEGSFITDGFAQGMEIAGAGFSAANNAPKIISEVREQFLAIEGGCAPQGVSPARTLTAGLPAVARRSWENLDFKPVAGWPYITEQWVPSTSFRRTTASNGGHMEERGQYILTWYGLAGRGPAAIRRSVDKLKALYTSGTVLMAGSEAVEVRGDAGPYAGAITPQDTGHASCVLTISWFCRSRNVVAA